MKPKFYKCEICGEKVFKEYWDGTIRISEEFQCMDGLQIGPHRCFLVHGKVKV